MWICKRYNWVFFCCFFLIKTTTLVYSQNTDSISIRNLEGVIVSEKRPQFNYLSTVSQTLDSSRLAQIPSLQVSDVVKFFSGVQIKDYGGMGGIKTISVRSLGSNHTRVAYDGLAVSDCQTGQINLGRFSLEYIDAIFLNNDYGFDIFQPAYMLNSANALQLFTKKPMFSANKPYNVSISFKGGSYTLLQPFILVENKISKHISSSFMFDYLYQKGDYPFTIKNGDSVVSMKRLHADIQSYKLEENLYFHVNDKHDLLVKLSYNYTHQNLPGAVIFYTISPSQQLWDESIFAQTRYQYNISKKFKFQSNIKWNYSYLRYLDTNFYNERGKIDNDYIQREVYSSNVFLYQMLDYWAFSMSNDLSFSNMDASVSDFSKPIRLQDLTALSSLFHRKKIQLAASIIYTHVLDLSEKIPSKKHINKWSPFLQIAYKPINKEDMYIKAFVKHSFRLPSFNDMYYQLVGNVNLLPENALQSNLSVSYSKYIHRVLPYVSVSTDVYYNRVKDKIVAIPNKNLFIWSMINLGEVSIVGVDAHVSSEWKITSHINLETIVNYTFQKAIDITDTGSKTYKNQIPYTPQHVSSGIIACHTKWINFSYTLFYVGERYVLGQNTPENLLQAYFDHGFSIYRAFSIKKTDLYLHFDILNITNSYYEVVKNYPMVGRQFQGKITYKF